MNKQRRPKYKGQTNGLRILNAGNGNQCVRMLDMQTGTSELVRVPTNSLIYHQVNWFGGYTESPKIRYERADKWIGPNSQRFVGHEPVDLYR